MELRKFLYSQAIVAAAVLIADVCSFVFYGLALQFTPEQFAEVTSLTALNFVVTVFSATIGTFILMKTKESALESDVTLYGMRLAITVGCTLTAIFICASPLIRTILHFETRQPFVILGMIAVPAMIISVLQSIQTAQKKFLQLAVGIVTLGAMRIPAGLLFFSDGYDSTDASWSILFAVSCTLAAIIAMNGHALRIGHFIPIIPRMRELRSLSELLWSLFIMGALLKMDILWVKHSLDPVTAGIYGMTSLIGSVLYYATMGLTRPAMSYVNKKNILRIVKLSVLGILAVCAGAAGGYFVIGAKIFAMISDHASDVRTAPLLLLFAAMTSYSVLSFSVQCLGVLHRTVHVRLMSAVVVGDAILLMAFGTTILAVAAVQAAVLTAGAVAAGLLLLHQRRKGVA